MDVDAPALDLTASTSIVTYTLSNINT